MTINKKRKQVHDRPAWKKKKVRSSRSHTVIDTEKGVQTAAEVEDDVWSETKVKVRKKESLKDDECLNQLNLKKKKNKKKRVSFQLPKEAHPEGFVSVEGHMDLQQQEQIKIFKKRRKKDQCRASLSLESQQSCEVEISKHYRDGIQEHEFAFARSRMDGELTKKKKKKDVFSPVLEDIQDSEYKQCQKDWKEALVHISEGKAGEGHGTEIIQSDGKGYIGRKKRKKKKCDSFSPLVGNLDNVSAVHDSPIALSDFRKRQRKEISFTNNEEKDTTENSGSIRQMKKKKKSKDLRTLRRKQGYGQRVCDKCLPTEQEAESEEKELSGKKRCKKSSRNEATKKKKKIEKDEETTFSKVSLSNEETTFSKVSLSNEETTFSKVSLSNDSASKSQKIMQLESNKKNKESKVKPAECFTGDSVDRLLCNSNRMLSAKKRKKAPEDSTEESGSKAIIKKRKIKTEDMGDEALEHVDDVTIVQEKKGNCDEINTDKVRRQALQEKSDRESGRTKVCSPKVDTKIGQWSAAAFQSSERGMKFLRLMGGFKKGSAPVEDLSATRNKPNMALNREGEEKLQQALEMEFDKAMDLKQHRRIGLGFQPAANKNVYIDKYASRSIKFED